VVGSAGKSWLIAAYRKANSITISNIFSSSLVAFRVKPAYVTEYDTLDGSGCRNVFVSKLRTKFALKVLKNDARLSRFVR
jgi:hypothetical protein